MERHSWSISREPFLRRAEVVVLCGMLLKHLIMSDVRYASRSADS